MRGYQLLFYLLGAMSALQASDNYDKRPEFRYYYVGSSVPYNFDQGIEIFNGYSQDGEVQTRLARTVTPENFRKHLQLYEGNQHMSIGSQVRSRPTNMNYPFVSYIADYYNPYRMVIGSIWIPGVDDVISNCDNGPQYFACIMVDDVAYAFYHEKNDKGVRMTRADRLLGAPQKTVAQKPVPGTPRNTSKPSSRSVSPASRSVSPASSPYKKIFQRAAMNSSAYIPSQAKSAKSVNDDFSPRAAGSQPAKESEMLSTSSSEQRQERFRSAGRKVTATPGESRLHAGRNPLTLDALDSESDSD